MNIDYEFIIKILEEIRQNYEETPKSKIPTWIYLFYQKIPESLKKHIIRPCIWGFESKQDNEKFILSQGDYKKWSIDFLNYVLKNPNAKLNLEMFEFEEDRYEIIKFVKNKLYLALGGKVEKKKLYDKYDFEKINQYTQFIKNSVNIKSNGTTYIVFENETYILPIPHVEMPLFYHKYGMGHIPKNILDNLKNKDIIDCGAFIGDSALLFSQKAKKIYAFEPDSKNYDLLLKTVELNKIKNNIHPIKKGVGDKTEKIKIINSGICSHVSKEINSHAYSGFEEIDVVRIDEFVKENNVNTGLIKMDIEGYELEAIWGARDTIRKFKPILIICLYHCGKDFFEIPPLLKKWVPEYEFRFLNLNAEHPIFERVLLGYSKN
ncbi:FkbM family methyltransferase [Methanococcus maripaludis]|uniref:FkbM family methyltransferase n=1 Tax=Methanococcus maripaludis TaxID=39152 RepID=A0A8T4CKS6_METMI|nr:FkbM family methyltransferase [Methanococcus maripaludis]MBM7409121.1 FkbM family methyltransferase [Methanococcus maripaludis]MBP2218693.1 FkbM family methyltransferase [Methanococcus maripaludis]